MSRIELKVVDDISEIPSVQWNGLLGPDDNPFVQWEFLEALEHGGCAAPERGWWPCHLTAWHGDELVAACPAYLKGDSAGDFSRDWGFAESASRNGLSYYPKMVIGVPFSPVTGRRILVREGYDRSQLFDHLIHLGRQLARHSQLSSIHVLYHLEDEVEAIEGAGLCHRVMIQYHWQNRSYTSTDDWMSNLKSKRRTQIRRERAEPARQGIRIRTVRGAELAADPERWAAEAWSLYERNTQKHYWGGTYLNQAFFERIFERMTDHVELVVAEHDHETVAGAINLATPTHLFGRYWGCHQEHRFLHFNVCLYHSIEQCIERSVQVFEGGAGGEHKLSRGFDPVLVHTSHLFLHRGFHEAIAGYVASEASAQRQDIAAWKSRGR